jgi:predicted nucleotidyltransferase
MELDKDFKEFLVLLNQNEVEYLVVGGYAVAFHGHPRYTGDLDIWVNSTDDNLGKLIKTIEQFGFESDLLKDIDFVNGVIAFHLGTPPVRVDIMNKISGVIFLECYPGKQELEIDGLKVPYIGFNDLILNKRASGRYKDLSDIENLQ